VYEVSQDYINTILSANVKERRITGLIDGTIPFDQDDLLAGSFSYIEKAVGSADINLGGVFIGQQKMTFLKSFADTIARGSWRGRTITASIGLKLADDSWEDVPLKPYTIDEADHSQTGMTVKAYDDMAKFDKPIAAAQSTGTFYDLANLACTACGVTLGMTAAQMAELPNGEETVSIYLDNDMSTWRDLVSWIAASCCCFATINRNGALEFRTWHSEPDFTIDKYHRFTGASFSDFQTYYTGLSIVNIEKGVVEYYGPVDPEEDTGLTMKLGSDPLLQYGTEETKTRQRRAILSALENFNYTPFKSDSIIDPAIDLGDVISYTDGIAGTQSSCCVMAINYQYGRKVQLQGYGKDPATSGAQSKTDKNINGLLARTSENEVITYTFTNAAKIEIGEETETTVIRLRFATINPKVVTIYHDIIIETEAEEEGGTVEVEAHYYLNQELLTFKPRSSWNNDGPHILPLMYFLNTLEGGLTYDWEVRLVVKQGTAKIQIDNAHAILQGQGLVAAEAWDGLLEAEDQITVELSGGISVNATDAVSFDWYEDEKINASDTVSPTLGGGLTVELSENVSITMVKDIFNLVSENGEYNIISEDGAYNIESEE